MRVVGDADDAHVQCALILVARHIDRRAERIAITKIPLHECCVDDRHLLGGLEIVRVELATRAKPDARGGKEVRRNDCRRHRSVLVHLRRRSLGRRSLSAAHAPYDGKRRAGGHLFHARQIGQPRSMSLESRSDARLLQRCAARVDVRDQDARRPIAAVGLLEIPQRGDEQRGGADQNQRERHLDDDESTVERPACSAAPSRRL